jgi:four helix bundle protein
MKIKRFEELECWKEARELNRMIYSLAQRTEFGKDFRLAGQTTGASISIMNNICEGFDSGSTNEFIRFLFAREDLAPSCRIASTSPQT